MRRTCRLLFLPLIFIGCQVPQTYVPPEIEVPNEWHAGLSEEFYADTPDKFLWWESLNDPILNELIHLAAFQNLDLKLAASRILEARYELKGKKAEFYPHIDASASYQHLYYSKEALINGVLKPAMHINERESVRRNIDFFEVGFDADWELDFFGVGKYEINALKAKIETSEENLNDVWVRLSAEIARNYVELRTLQQRINIISKNIETQTETYELTKELIKIGSASTVDLMQVEQQLNVLESKKPILELSSKKAIYRISILLGYLPADLFDMLNTLGTLPCQPQNNPIGIPSELLRRRPDIRKAERELAVASEEVNVAISSYFPRFSLRGFIGDISTHLPSLFSGKSATWLAGPEILLPVFNSRMVTQDIDFNKIKRQQALLEYQKSVLNALEETENAIASYHFELKRNRHLNEARKTSANANEMIQELYRRGIKDYLEVLVTNRTYLDAEDAFIESQSMLLLDYIFLYKALGGGWENPSFCIGDESECSE